MDRVFKEKVKVPLEVHKRLLQFSNVYRTYYNKALEVQVKNRSLVQTREEQFMTLDKIEREVDNLNLRFDFKFDRGIMKAALIEARSCFYSWWSAYIEGSKKLSTGDLPRFISKNKDLPSFSTLTIVRVDKNGLYLSRLGYLKFKNEGYIPFGSYKNVKLSLTGSFWTFKLESTFEVETSQAESKTDSLEVVIGLDCSFQIGDINVSSILNMGKYSNRVKKLANYQKRYDNLLKEKSFSDEEFYKVQKQISILTEVLRRMRITYVSSIVNKIMKLAPAEVSIRAEHSTKSKFQNFNSKQCRQSSILVLLKIIKAKLESCGVVVSLKEMNITVLKSEGIRI